jgi:hypothetical protein
MSHARMPRSTVSSWTSSALIAVLLIVGVGVIACTRVVVIEAGPEPDASVITPDAFESMPADADFDSPSDASIIDDASDFDAL